jgi:hypothetical protein
MAVSLSALRTDRTLLPRNIIFLPLVLNSGLENLDYDRRNPPR